MTKEERKEQILLYKELLRDEIEREEVKYENWLRAEQKLIDMLEKHPQVKISMAEPDLWILDKATLKIKPNPNKYKNPRLDLLRKMLGMANKVV